MPQLVAKSFAPGKDSDRVSNITLTKTRSPADDPFMTTLYTWVLRNTFLAFGLVAGAAGAVGILEPGMALSIAALCGFVAYIGSHFARRAKRRAKERDAIAREIAAAHALRERFSSGQKSQKRAA